jgi:chorismate synthase
MPAGVRVRQSVIDGKLALRQQGPGRGGRQKIERDHADIIAGVRGGESTGAPIGLLVANRDWENWQGVLGSHPEDVDADRAESKALYRPRPGHADLAGALKYDRRDLRDVLERASARETAVRVAVGAICQELLESVGIRVLGHVVALGAVRVPTRDRTIDALLPQVAASDCRCASTEATAEMHQAIKEATLARDSLGGVIQVQAEGVPAGLGSYAASDRRLDGELAGALMSIQAMKGVEIGMGFDAAAVRGSAVHDEILPLEDAGLAGRFRRPTNNAGGIEGGVSNGEAIVVRCAMKPIPTLLRPLRSVDMRTHEVIAAGYERSDVTSVPAASVVAEAAVAFVLARALLEKCGGDSLGELQRNLAGYRAQMAAR